MLTEATLKRALRQMRLYGEIGPGRGSRRGKPMSVPAEPDRSQLPAGERKARVWDEEKGAFLLKPV